MTHKESIAMSKAFGHKTWIKPRHDKKALKKGHNAVAAKPKKMAKMTAREESFYNEMCEAFIYQYNH